MRKFYPRLQAIGVTFKEDGDFGDIYPTLTQNIYTNDFLKDLNESYLNEQKGKELKSILEKHPNILSGKMQIVNVEEHRIRLVEEAVRKKPYIYRVPETLKPNVDEQIKELESLDLIEARDSEIVYPVLL